MRHTYLARALLLVTALASLPALCASADDEIDPAAAYSARTALLPAPAAEKAMRFEGVVRLNGKRMGYAVFEMRPVAGEPPTWEAVDHMVLKPQGVPMTETATAHLSSHLAPLSGSVVSNQPGSGEITWQQGDKGFTATRKAEGAEDVVKTFEHAGTALNTLSATIWFLREALPAASTYRTSILEVKDGLKGKPALRPVELKVLGEQDLDGKTILAATGKKADKELSVMFRPADRSIIGVRLVHGAQKLEILAGDMWTMPAHDAVTAGLRAAFAFGTGDMEILDDVIHWPSMHEAILKQHPPAEGQPAPSVAQLRQKLLQTWEQRIPKNPAEMIRGVLLGLKDSIEQEERDDGSVHLQFPPVFKNMGLLVAKHDGVWSLVALPTTGE